MHYPKQLYSDLESILNFDEPTYLTLVQSLDSVDPFADAAKFLKSATGQSESGPKIERALRALLFITFDRSKSFAHLTLHEFLEFIEETLRTNCKAQNPDGFPKLIELLAKTLNGENNLGLSVKANDLLVQNERNFLSAKIISDIRSVFKEDEVGEKPLAAVISHTLKIEFAQEGEKSAFYIGIDESELIELRRALERAEDKACVLRNQINLLGIPYIKVFPSPDPEN